MEEDVEKYCNGDDQRKTRRTRMGMKEEDGDKVKTGQEALRKSKNTTRMTMTMVP